MYSIQYLQCAITFTNIIIKVKMEFLHIESKYPHMQRTEHDISLKNDT
jgi:hypothetical protein